MHMDLYKGFYHTPDDFLADILRIQANAEINALLENDAEAPVKAGQMVNHSKVMIDQTFDVQFKTDCARMAERMKERENNRPEGEKKGKGKGKGKAVVSEREAIAAAAAAAGGGGRYGTRSRGTRAEANGPVELPDIGALERGLKRSRTEGEDSHAEDEGPAPPKKARGVNGIEGGEDDEDAPGEDDDEVQPVTSTSQLNGIHFGGPATNGFEDSFNHVPLPALTLTNSLLPDAFPLGHELAPPMPVGGLLDLDDMEFAGPLDDLPPLPDLDSFPISTLQGGLLPSFSLDMPHVPEAGPSTSVRFAEIAIVVEPEAKVVVATEQEATPPNPASDAGAPVPDAAPREPSPIVVDPPTPEPLPDFILSPSGVESLVRELSEETDGLNVEQLEQLRAACYDIIWRGRKEWERDGMVEEIRELAREFVEEVRESC